MGGAWIEERLKFVEGKPLVVWGVWVCFALGPGRFLGKKRKGIVICENNGFIFDRRRRATYGIVGDKRDYTKI